MKLSDDMLLHSKAQHKISKEWKAAKNRKTKLSARNEGKGGRKGEE